MANNDFGENILLEGPLSRAWMCWMDSGGDGLFRHDDSVIGSQPVFSQHFFFPVCNSDRNTTRAWLQPQHHPLKPQWPHTELPTTNPTLTWPCDTAWEEEKNMGQKAHCAASQGVLSGTHNLSIVFCMCVLLYTVRTSFIHGSEDIMASPYFLRHLQRVKSWV